MKNLKLAKRYNKFDDYLYDSGYYDDARHLSEESTESIIRDYAARFQVAVDGFFNSTTANKIADRYLSKIS